MKLTRFEKFELAIPFALLVAGFAIMALKDTAWSMTGPQIDILFIALLGNFFHNFLFAWQLYRIPELSDWRKTYRFHGLRIEVLLLAVFLFFWLVVRLVIPDFHTMKVSKEWPLFESFIAVVFLSLNVHHTIAQTRGVSFAFSYKLKNAGTLQDMSRTHRGEFWFARLLFVEGVYVLCWAYLLKWQTSLAYRLINTLLLLSFFAALVLHFYRSEPRAWKMKTIFYSRSLIRGFIYWSPVGLFLAFAQHSTEAMVIYWKMISRSASSSKRRLKIELLSLFAASTIFYIAFYYFSRDFRFYQEVKIFLVAIFLTHYVSEGFMFRFRNPLTREKVAPLLSDKI